MPANPPVTPIDLRRSVQPAPVQGEDFFREAFAHASVGIAVTDLAGRFLQVNAAFCAITGYSQAELLATTSLYGEVLARTTLDDEDEAAVGAEQVDG